MLHVSTCSGDALDGGLHANSFWNGAVNNQPTGAPTPYRYVNAPGKQMNITNLATDRSAREMNDFLFLMAHGNPHHMAIWTADGTIWYPYDPSYDPTQWHFGTNYTRWIYFQSCDVLRYDPADTTDDFWGNWDLAFGGAQTCLGYGTTIHDNPYYVSTTGKFWNKWAGSNQMGIWEAQRQATYENGYNDGYNVTPAALCSKDPTSYTHIYLGDTYNAATSGAGMNYAYVYQYVDYVHP